LTSACLLSSSPASLISTSTGCPPKLNSDAMALDHLVAQNRGILRYLFKPMRRWVSWCDRRKTMTTYPLVVPRCSLGVWTMRSLCTCRCAVDKLWFGPMSYARCTARRLGPYNAIVGKLWFGYSPFRTVHQLFNTCRMALDLDSPSCSHAQRVQREARSQVKSQYGYRSHE
jgi:hypothetical protein